MNNPLQMIQQYMSFINSNPVLKNALNLAQQGKSSEVEQIARNFCKSQGRDFDTEFKQFMDSMH